LNGKAPFQGKTYKEVLALNKAAIINYDVPGLKFASDDAVDLLK
jgi:hypothetical protein